jgi:hypothetical protein
VAPPEAFIARIAGPVIAGGVDHRDAGMKADHPDMGDAAQRRRDGSQPARRKDERIAAGDDHLPDLAALADIGEGRVERLARQRPNAPGPTISRRKQNRQ